MVSIVDEAGVTRPEDVSTTEEEWGPGHSLWNRMSVIVAGNGPGRMSPVRLASHLAVFVVTLLVILFSRMHFTQIDLVTPIPASASSARGELASTNLTPLISTVSTSRILPGQDFLERAVLPYTIIPERARLNIITYTVQAGDTVYGIAGRFEVSTDTILWANGRLQFNPDLLKLGQKLLVLPVSGVLHTVEPGETTATIARKYKVAPNAIVSYQWNQLDSDSPTLKGGQWLIVPGGEKPYVPPVTYAYSGPVPEGARKGTGSFVWPASGRITQGYWDRHRALDIGAPLGASVKASDTGFVVVAGWSDYGYGNYIIIDHGNGYQTLYSHLSRILVERGQSVGQGAVVGKVGSTGNSTGSHLHFEIRYRGSLRNPFGFLP